MIEIMKKKNPQSLKLNKTVSLTPREKAGLLYFTKGIKKSLKDNVSAVQLYGSRARGDARPNSDTDVLVVLKRKSERSKNTVYDISIEVLRKYNLIISLHIMDQKSYEYEKNLPSLFMQFLDNDGIDL